MSNVRVWVAILALVSFLAGTASGLLIAERTRPQVPTDAPFEEYARAFVERFELAPARARPFRELLRHYHTEIEDVRQRALASSLSAMEPRLVELGLRYRDLIRDKVLPPDRRAEFDALAESWPPLH